MLSVFLRICAGDNMLTALSVARQCGMVGPRDRVVLIHAHPPENGRQARISWEVADTEPEASSTADAAILNELEGVRIVGFTGREAYITVNFRKGYGFVGVYPHAKLGAVTLFSANTSIIGV